VNFLINLIIKGLNKLLKKLRDSGSMTRRTGNGRRRNVRSDALLVFHMVQYEHIKRNMNWAVYMYLFQISWGMFLPKSNKIG